MEISLDSLMKMTIGSEYANQEGHSKVTIQKRHEGIIVVSECDSLTILVTELREKIVYLNKEKTAVNTHLIEQVEVPIKLSKFQNFLLWSGGVAWGIFILGVIIKIKFK